VIGVQSVRWHDQHPQHTDRVERLPDKCTIRMKAGDVVRMLTGGGWGEPVRNQTARSDAGR